MRFTLNLAVAVAVIAIAACSRAPHGGMSSMSSSMSSKKTSPADPASYGSEVEAGYARVRSATSAFKNLASAVAAGYAENVKQCLADSAHGAMGYHHINRALLDTKIEYDKPEILLYEKRPDGSYRLNGVEFIIPYRVWPKDSVPPKLMGRDMYRADDLNLWYTHMWVWTANSAGLFANYNPAAKCIPKE